MRGPKPEPLTLSDAERKESEVFVRRHSTPQQLALRERIILAAAQGKNNSQIARELGIRVDTVRALSRLVRRAKGLVKEHLKNVELVCRSRLRSARQVAQTLHRQLRRKAEEKEAQQQAFYQKLIETTEQMVRQSQQVAAALAQQTGQQAKRLLIQARQVLPLVERVIAQTRTRVLDGKKMASGEKVFSLFVPHTRAIPRHKGGALVEFGRHVVLNEVEGGIVTRYQLLEHPTEHGQALEAVAHHRMLFEHPPNLVAGDRDVHSVETEPQLTAAGVKLVAIPAEGKVSEERQAALAHAPPETGVSLACGHRGEDCQPEAGLWMAQK